VLLCGCEVACWNSGRYGQRVLTGVFGCEGEEVTRRWTQLYNKELVYCSAGTEVDKRGRECSIHYGGNICGKRWL
jgi:hypothetical protein